jgi:methylphosphotriester-DNA--protein-cysteine methyltransferase
MVTNRRAAVIIADLWRRAGYRPSIRCDMLATDAGLSFAEACGIAARHLARTGRARQAEAALRSGMTVRALLRALYGVNAGPEWDAAAERRAFLRTLRIAKLRAVN